MRVSLIRRAVSSAALAVCALLCLPAVVLAGKKGVAVNVDGQDHGGMVQNLGASWYYNWGPSPNAGNVEFVPMIWGANDVGRISSLPGSEWILAFNEPNMNSQANMSPQQAASLWHYFEASGRKIVGPAMADCPPGPTGPCIYGTLNWYRDFFAACPNCRVDAVAMHLYYCNADDMKNKIKLLHDVVQRPIWLTEFACDGASSNQDAVDRLASQLVPWLNDSDMVGRYAWFMLMGDNGSLMFNSLFWQGSRTPTGNYYAGASDSAEVVIAQTSSSDVEEPEQEDSDAQALALVDQRPSSTHADRAAAPEASAAGASWLNRMVADVTGAAAPAAAGLTVLPIVTGVVALAGWRL